MMNFQNHKIRHLFNQSQKVLKTKDEYKKLVNFERYLIDYMLEGTLTDQELLEAHKVLHNVNAAQIKLLEVRLGKDLDGDGHVGPNSWIY